MDKKIQKLRKNFNNIEVPSEVDMVIELAIKRGKRYRKISFIRPIITTAACLCIFIAVLGINKNPLTDGIITEKNIVAEVLPKVGSYENLQVLLSGFKSNPNYAMRGSGLIEDSALKSYGKMANSTTNFGAADATTAHSNTNQQVKGVDEGDNVKNDGEYIYKITGNKVIITKAVPAEKLEISSQINFEATFYPTEMLLKDKYLVVIGGQGGTNTYNSGRFMSDDVVFAGNSKTQIRIFDISDKKNPSMVRSLEIDGRYSQARMIDDSIFIISNKTINFLDDKLKDEVPTYKDSLIGDKTNNISYGNIGYCKDAIEPNYIILTSLDLDNIKDKVNITTVLGSGNNIYASENNIYVAGYSLGSNGFGLESSIYKGKIQSPTEEKTTIYKFKLNKATTSFITSGEVKGTILNQFSMDESQEYFRIATTENSNDIKKATNNLFVLNSEMKVVGKLEGLAPTEKIYSTRFIGDRVYMVTFKQTDPLFVIDLKVPETPKVLGELKIPGFSNYLEPYDENHLIGFGEDTVDVNEGGGVMARPIGMKIAIFDVTEVTKPIEQFQTKVQGENSYSEVLNNHKALLFSKEKNLLSFPVQYSIGGAYYQGASVYKVDLKTGFTLKGNITHEDIKAVKGNQNLLGQAQIDRELYIGDNIYTISNIAIKVNNIQTLKAISQLVINPEAR